MISEHRFRSLLKQSLLFATFFISMTLLHAQETSVSTTTTIQPVNPAAKDSIRLLFDAHAGFKPFRIAAEDGSRHPLLNPEAEQPVTLYLLRNGAILPLVNTPVSASKEGDPGYRGPAFTAQDIQVQLWGLDLGANASNWSALRYEFFNTSNTVTTVSVRFILDTWLGEASKEHITVVPTNGTSKLGIADETRVFLQEQPQLIGAQKLATADGFWLLLPSSKSISVVPQRVIVANVRRLQNSDASFESEDHRAFNLLPFSVNDSALGLFYDSITILPHQKISIDIVFTTQSEVDPSQVTYIANKLNSIKPSIDNTVAPVANNASSKTQLRNATQITKLDALIERLNTILKEKNYRQGEVEMLLQSIAETRKSLQTAP